MRQTFKTIGLILVVIVATTPIRALGGNDDCKTPGRDASPYRQDTMSVRINFRFNDTMVLRDFKNNNAGFSRIKSSMKRITDIDSISIIGSASPDGLTAHNRLLAQKRAEMMRLYLYWRYPNTHSIPIRIHIEPDMIKALRWHVDSDPNIPHRDKVIEVLSAEGGSVETRIANLKLIPGESYNYINREIFPQMRRTVSYLLYYKTSATISEATIPLTALTSSTISFSETEAQTKADATEAQGAGTQATQTKVETTEIEATQTKVETTEIQATEVQATDSQAKADDSVTSAATSPYTTHDAKSDSLASTANTVDEQAPRIYNPRLALKTNLLFNALTAINLEIEVPIGKQWSVAGELIFPWWLNKEKQRCFQLMNGNIEGRYWFGNREQRPLMTGWFAGLYAGGGYYDLEWETKGYQGEFFIAAGLSGGYAHTINKKETLRMEYSLGIGFMQTKYREYAPEQGGDVLMWQRDGKFTWFGPTRAKVSLVWMLDYKFKKGWLK